MESKASAISTTRSTPKLLALASLLYFAQGFPYGLVTELFPVYLRVRGIGRGEIGLVLSTVGLAWTLKFLWAPAVDRFGTYRIWIGGALLVIACSTLAMQSSALATGAIFTLLTLVAIASATQDIAIDGYTIVITPNEKLGIVNATRVAAFRVALITSGGALAAAASFFSWNVAFMIASGIMLATFALVLASLRSERPSAERNDLLTEIKRLAGKAGLLPLLAVVILYRVGDSALAPMIKVFWVDSGYTTAEIGNVTTTLGIAFTIAGGFLGGVIVQRFGIYSSLVMLGAAAAASNIGYALAATLGPTRALMYPAAIVESFTQGLGITAFLAFLMVLCERRFAATEYALFTAIYGLGRSVAGSISGYGVDALGFATFFWITFALAIPGLIAVVSMRGRIEAAVAEHEASG